MVAILLVALLVAVGIALYLALRGGNLFVRFLSPASRLVGFVADVPSSLAGLFDLADGRRHGCSTSHDAPGLGPLPLRWVLVYRLESHAECDIVERFSHLERRLQGLVEPVRQAVHGHAHRPACLELAYAGLTRAAGRADPDKPTGAPSKTDSTNSDRPSGSSGGGGGDKSTLGPSPSSSPTGDSSSGGPLVDDSLKGHNDFRATHHADALAWNDTLAEAAQRWVENCVFEHSGGSLLSGQVRPSSSLSHALSRAHS